MNLKNPLRLALLTLFTFLPTLAHASSLDTERCGTPYPFWWRHIGALEKVAIKDILINAKGEDFAVTLTLVNTGRELLPEGTVLAVTQSAHLAEGYKDPSIPAPPEDAKSLVATELISLVKLPALKPEESIEVSGLARSFGRDLNHVLSVNVYDGRLVTVDPDPNPWRWFRAIGPATAPDAIRVVRSSVEAVRSDRPGYKALAFKLALQNVSREKLEAGLPLLVTHDSAGAAVGYWNPEDNIDPNNPGNPYASIFRELLYQSRLEKTLEPGGILTVSGTAYVPESITSLEVVTVSVGN